jgi:hypothetical protein
MQLYVDCHKSDKPQSVDRRFDTGQLTRVNDSGDVFVLNPGVKDSGIRHIYYYDSIVAGAGDLSDEVVLLVV